MEKKSLVFWIFLVFAIAAGFWTAFPIMKSLAEEKALKQKPADDLTQKEKPKEKKEAPKSNPAIEETKKKGMDGVDFYYDVLGAPPGQDPQEISQKVKEKDIAEKPKVMDRQKKLLNDRYQMECKNAQGIVMTKGKPQPVGPTVRLTGGVTWEKLGQMTPEEIKEKKVFPAGFHRLPHVKHEVGGMVFPQVQIDQFPRLQRFDVDFDLPECFLPEFPSPIFLTTHPELGDVSQGEVLSLDNFDRLFRGLVTPVQLDGLRLLVTPFPQEEFNQTHDRKSDRPSPGIACLDCHVNFHTTGQFHLNPDTRPQKDRLRLDTVSLRGMFAQQIHGSKRSIRSVEDFTEFEQRTAYFNGDQIRAVKKGANVLDRFVIPHMAQMQNMIDFPPAPKLDPVGRLDKRKATEQELRGEALFFGKGRCVECHTPPAYTDHNMHDLKLERFGAEADGPIKAFALRGVKDSPPYFHDGRLLTLEDTVEFFNLVLELKLNPDEKKDLVAFMRAL
jgi:cytochrome c peroxidase